MPNPPSPEVAQPEMFQKRFPEGFQQTPWAARGKFLGQGPGCNREGMGKSRRLIDLCAERPGGGSVPGHGAAPGQRHRAGDSDSGGSGSGLSLAISGTRAHPRLCSQERAEKGTEKGLG